MCHTLSLSVIIIMLLSYNALCVEGICHREKFRTMRTKKTRVADLTRLRYSSNNNKNDDSTLTQPPSYQIFENDAVYQVLLHLPGVSPKDINISIIHDNNNQKESRIIQVQGRRSKKSSSLFLMTDRSKDGTEIAAAAIEYKKQLIFDSEHFNTIDLVTEYLNKGAIRLTIPKRNKIVE